MLNSWWHRLCYTEGSGLTASGINPLLVNRPKHTKRMTTETTTPTTPATVTPEVNTTEAVTLTYKETPIRLTRMETQAKGDNAPVTYWGMDLVQYGDNVYTTLCTLLGKETLHGMIAQKLNTNLKAAQLEQGKDKYTMADKEKYVREYILADFGVNSKGGGAAIKALKEQNTKQGNVLAKLVELHGKFAKATPEDAAKILAEIQVLTAEASKLIPGA